MFSRHSSRLLNRLKSSSSRAAFTGATPAPVLSHPGGHESLQSILHKDNIRVVQIASVVMLSVGALLVNMVYLTVNVADYTSELKEFRNEIRKEMRDSERRLLSQLTSIRIALSSLSQSRPNTTELPPIKKEQSMSRVD
jgi:hypothetical protein